MQISSGRCGLTLAMIDLDTLLPPNSPWVLTKAQVYQ